jgi:putative IMPACT (imprinted ancient) family translation regulator
MQPMCRGRLEIDYALLGRLQEYLKNMAVIENISYAQGVELELIFRPEQTEEISQAVLDMSAGGVDLETYEEFFMAGFPF